MIYNMYRYIWLSAPYSLCWSRLENRRYDPESSRIVNLKSIPKDLEGKDLSSWIHAPFDHEKALEERFKVYENVEKEMKKLYGLKNNVNTNGIFHSIPSEGVGEGDADGSNPHQQKVLELAEGYLVRPIPQSF
jgi:hypothetical protein